MKVKILVGSKILKVILETKDLSKEPKWRWMPANARGSWPVTVKMGHDKEWPNRNRLDCPEPAATSLLERDGEI